MDLACLLGAAASLAVYRRKGWAKATSPTVPVIKLREEQVYSLGRRPPCFFPTVAGIAWMCKTVLTRGKPNRSQHCPDLNQVKEEWRGGEGFADHYSFIRAASVFLCSFRQLLPASEKSQSPVISGINHAWAQGEPSRSLSFTQLKSAEPAVCG